MTRAPPFRSTARLSGLGLVVALVHGTASSAAGIDDWRGRLFTCGSHPPVHIPAAVAYAYEKDLTHATQGTVSFGRSSATVSFPGKYGTFTIVKRKTGYVSNGKKCAVDGV